MKIRSNKSKRGLIPPKNQKEIEEETNLTRVWRHHNIIYRFYVERTEQKLLKYI